MRRATSRCLGESVVEYVARSLPPSELLGWDRHLVACSTCRRAVDDERWMLARMSVAPTMPTDLRTVLLSLASLAPSVPPPPPAPAHVRIAVRRQPALPVTPSRLAVVAPSAPACHRSALRSAVLATVAAGASAAAAWSMAVTGAAAPVATSPAPGPTGGALQAQLTGSFGSAAASYPATPASAYTARNAFAQTPVLLALQTAFPTPRGGVAMASGAQSTP